MDILLCGAGGRMGAAVAAAANETGHRIAAGIDPNPAATSPFPVFSSPEECTVQADVIIDFSHHSALPALLDFAEARHIPAVICTTGHTEEELSRLARAAERIPVFYSRNMSLGINLLMALCRRAAAALGTDFDVEIVEKHHRNKLDAPSGTALMLADAVASADEEPHPLTFDRTARRAVRPRGEIGISSVRGGSIVGEHEVIFAGKDEVLTLTHTATSREVFATGALRAAAFLAGKPAGLYDMNNLLG